MWVRPIYDGRYSAIRQAGRMPFAAIHAPPGGSGTNCPNRSRNSVLRPRSSILTNSPGNWPGISPIHTTTSCLNPVSIVF